MNNAIHYDNGIGTRYQTHKDIYEEFLTRTGISPSVIEDWEAYGRTGEIKIWLAGGGYIIYGNFES